MIRLEHHRQGPRVHVLGRRVHEWHLGLAILAALGATWLAHLWSYSTPGAIAGAAGVWLVLKDWRDIRPSQRDTSAWRLGLHRPSAPLRAMRHSSGMPAAAGAAAFVVGSVNLLSALTPNIGWRGHLLLGLEPVEAVPVFHTLAVPASVALIVAAWHLRLRRRRALLVAIALMAILGVLSLLKGLDFEEAILSWAVAAVLYWGRAAFCVRHERLRVHRRLRLLALATAAVFVFSSIVIWALTVPETGPLTVARDIVDWLAWTKGSLTFHDELSWAPLVFEGLGLLAIVAAAGLIFRPLAPPGRLPGRADQQAALALVRSHGDDTLAFFKLRTDVHYLFAPDRQAFAAYRVENGVLLLSGDPVGHKEALPGLVREACAFAEMRGLRLGAVGASERSLPLWQQAGLRSLYIGDEAIVETRSFSLDGRAIRKVRQAVARVEKAGYETIVCEVASLDPDLRAELERVSAAWLEGGSERGFSMAMDSLSSERHGDSLVVVALDSERRIGGFIHFVPSYGRAAMSLSLMRRDRETPNGLMEFLVVRSIELLRERGVEELSLNFAAFGRLLSRPSCRTERFLGRVVTLGNPFFQIESLHRFNAKFEPRWEPRYLVYEGALGLPRVGLAALRIEGQLPRLRA